MAEITKKSRMAIVEETTEGTLKAPSAGTDYLAVQDGFSTTLDIATLENSELKASIGSSQDITGFEEPSASVSHYLRHSGTEGQAPQSGYSVLFKAAYGSEAVAGAELTTAVGSTTTLIKYADTSSLEVGEALLIKHAASAYEIAIIESIPNGTDVVPLFELDNAPASGTATGQAVLYKAADSGHPSLSIHDYRGNGGAYAAIAGARVESTSIEASAGELINCSFDIAGIKGFYNPLEVQAGVNDKVDFGDGATQVATITAKVYKTPIELASELQTKMDAQSTDTITVTYSNTDGKYTLASDGGTFELLWSTGANTATTIGALIGFDTAADDTGATTYTGDNAISLASPQTPAFDDPGTPLVAKNNRVLLGDQDDNVCFSTQSISYELSTPKTDELDVCAESGKSGSIINEREVTVSMVANLPKYDADKFNKFSNNQSLRFQYDFGSKSAGNWEAGKAGVLAIKDASVLAHNLGDADGLVTLELEIKGFVDANGTPETYLNFV